MTNIAMIPARMGSQRLQKKNLAPLKGVPLIVHAIRKCREAGVFDRIIVNSEHPRVLSSISARRSLDPTTQRVKTS